MPGTISRTEWPTLWLALGNYILWGVLVFYGGHLPLWVLFFLGGFNLCLHGSLQHETIHGHPTASNTLNTLLAWLPLGLIYPYAVYKETHLRHLRVEEITDPEIDPESYFTAESGWNRFGAVRKYMHKMNFTFAGRMLLGPFLVVYGLVRGAIIDIAKGDRALLRIWLIHIAAITGILWFVTSVAGMPVWTYVVCFAWPGMMFTLIRSFSEHRPAVNEEHRTRIVEGSWFTQLLFLNVNIHWVHHQRPELPWYRVAAEFRANQEEVLRRNGGFYARGYWQVIREHFLSPWQHPNFASRNGPAQPPLQP